MEFLPLFIGYLLFCLGCVTIYALGDQPFMTTGTIGKLRFLAYKTFKNVIPEYIWNFVLRIIDFLFYKRNRTFQIIYIFLFLLSHVVLVTDVLPYLYLFHPNQSHGLIPLILFIATSILYIICCISDPGEINHKNYGQYRHIYKYDGELYKEDTTCQTCDFCKPARSKHCSTCDMCVFKFDHHCVWTNKCIGGRNQRYFLAYLIILCLIVANGIYMACVVLHDITVYQSLWSAKYVDKNGIAQDMTLVFVVQHLFMHFPRTLFLAVFLSVFAVLLAGFTVYHTYLAIKNQTTNERYKRYYLSMERKRKNVKEENLNEDVENPYDKGISRNLMEMLSPLQRINKRGHKNGDLHARTKFKHR